MPHQNLIKVSFFRSNSATFTQYNPKLRCWGMIGKYSISLFNESKTYFWLFCVCSKNTAVHNYIKSELKFLKIDSYVWGGTCVAPSSHALTQKQAGLQWHCGLGSTMHLVLNYLSSSIQKTFTVTTFPMSRCCTSLRSRFCFGKLRFLKKIFVKTLYFLMNCKCFPRAKQLICSLPLSLPRLLMWT